MSRLNGQLVTKLEVTPLYLIEISILTVLFSAIKVLNSGRRNINGLPLGKKILT